MWLNELIGNKLLDHWLIFGRYWWTEALLYCLYWQRNPGLCCVVLMGLDILILVNNDKPTSPRFGQTIYNNTVNFAGRGGLGTALNIMILHHYCHTSSPSHSAPHSGNLNFSASCLIWHKSQMNCVILGKKCSNHNLRNNPKEQYLANCNVHCTWED